MLSQGADQPGCSFRSPGRSGEEARSAGPSSLDELEQLDANALRAQWRRLFRADAPHLSRDLIVRALAYRVQERERGGLSKAALQRLGALARERKASGEGSAKPAPSLRPGTRLVREWRGRTHTVAVAEAGFEYVGAAYSSLSAIAKLITGAHWSGPRFFGLAKRRAAASRAPPGTSPAGLARPDGHIGAEREAHHG